eukprot:TRINITY_DN36254_c0_g1_i1.p1 TRINITY_DN36254_c0_g1~~TRINITY_DN36254_c0_g1_i1.p1  ORF type:complete len:375 (-),score=94.15 TRINITY_DN36254_c0_g1_i1:470-1504(-)
MAAPSARLGLALFGLGRAGTIHAHNVVSNPETELLYIVELDLEKARAWAAAHSPTTKVVASAEFESVFADPAVRAVVVASTTSTHEAIIRAAIAKKTPVFSEKPIAATVDSTLAVCKAAMAADVPLFCGFNRRLDTHFVAAHRRREELGKLMVIRSTSRDHPSVCPMSYIRVSGGQYVDQTVHDLDVLMWIAGERPHTVFAVGHAFADDIREIGDTDTVMVTLQFPSGCMATCDNTRRAVYGYDCRLEILGEKGMLSMENPRPEAVTMWKEDGALASPMASHFSSRFASAYAAELSHFVDFLSGRVERLRITAEEAYAAVKVSKAAADSFKSGQPVRISWEEEQ